MKKGIIIYKLLISLCKKTHLVLKDETLSSFLIQSSRKLSGLLKIKNFASLVFGNFNCKDLKYNVFLQTLIIGLIFIPNIIVAQRLNHEVTKEKNNNRFIASIDISDRQLEINQHYGSLVKSIKLGIEWWELMNEPMEKYMFKWERNSFVRSNKHNVNLDEKTLAKYPDLLKRFQNLKPSYISVKFNVTFSYDDPLTQNNQNILKTLPTCARKKSLGLYTSEFEVSRKINSRGNFFIDKAGVVGNDLVASSPKTWKDFLPFACNTDEISLEQVRNIYKSVNKANFSSLEIIKIENPETEIDAIASEYEKREKMSEEVKVADWSLKDDKKKDSWGDNEDKKKDSWGESSKPKDDWTDINKDKSTANKNAETFKIEYKDGKYGVVSSSGKILIPFQFDKIEKYDEKYGLAFVSKRTYESNLPKHSCEYGNVNIETYEEGVVDKFGNFTVPPKKIAAVRISQPYRVPSLKIIQHDPNYVYNAERERRIKQENEERERKKQEESKRCRNRIKESAESCERILISRGYTIK